MSLEAMVWALKHAPDVPPQCVIALVGLADHADSKGRGAYIGQKLLAEYARKSDRQVRSDLIRLQELQLIRKGDQSLAAHIPADCRPVVYDLALERKRTSARQPASARNQASPATSDRFCDLQEPGRNGSTLPGGSETQRERKPASYKPTDNLKTKKTSRAPRRNLNDGRDDVMRLCDHLAERIEGNGNKRPKISVEWQDAARLMIDNDKLTEPQIHKAVDWCQSNEFWRKNVMSMPTLREKYDRLRMDAEDELKAKRRAGANGKVQAPPLVGVSPRDEHRYRR
jgi:hypothetical protein